VRRALAVATVLLSAPSLAYVIPAFSVLRRLVERRDGLRLTALRVSGTATFTAEGAREVAAALGIPGEREIQTEAVISLKPPGRCRADVTLAQGKSSAVVVSQGQKRVEGTEIPSVSEALAQVCPLLALRSAGEGDGRPGVERHLRGLGVEDRQSSLARFDGRIVYVLGKAGPEQPQLWVYKDVFQPARVLYKDGQGRKWDVRFRDFASGVAGDWFPRIVEVARGEETLARFTALSADGRAALADNLF
jgi:hypothetical protein